MTVHHSFGRSDRHPHPLFPPFPHYVNNSLWMRYTIISLSMNVYLIYIWLYRVCMMVAIEFLFDSQINFVCLFVCLIVRMLLQRWPQPARIIDERQENGRKQHHNPQGVTTTQKKQNRSNRRRRNGRNREQQKNKWSFTRSYTGERGCGILWLWKPRHPFRRPHSMDHDTAFGEEHQLYTQDPVYSNGALRNHRHVSNRQTTHQPNSA